MTTLTADDIHCAIETLETSYTFDPPSRWLESYSALEALTSELTAQIKPYQWIRVAFIALAIAVFAWWVLRTWSDPLGQYAMFGNSSLSALVVSLIWLIPAMLIALGNWLYFKIASRRYPLIRFLPQIIAATDRFHTLAREAQSDAKENAAA